MNEPPFKEMYETFKIDNPHLYKKPDTREEVAKQRCHLCSEDREVVRVGCVLSCGHNGHVGDAADLLHKLEASIAENRQKDAVIERLKREYSKFRCLHDANPLSGLNGGGLNILGDQESIKKVKNAIWYYDQRDELMQEWKNRLELAELRSLGGERWIEIKEGCEMPPYGVYVWTAWNGVVQKISYARDIGEWIPFDKFSDAAPDGTFSHWMKIPAPPTREKE